MNNLKRKLVMAGVVAAVAVSGAIASPQSALANSSDRVCLSSSSSAKYSYLNVQYLFDSSTHYVNRGGCSSTSFNTHLNQWSIPAGFTCYDSLDGSVYFDRHWYRDGGYHNLKCKVNGGSW